VTKKKKTKKPKKKSASKSIKKTLPVKQDSEKVYKSLKKSRFPITTTFFVKNEKKFEEAIKATKLPVIMKASGRKLTSSKEYAGINEISDENEALKMFKKIMRLKNTDAVMIQKPISGIEFIVRTKADVRFGHFVSVALGGKYKEKFKEVKFRICPITSDEARQLLDELSALSLVKDQTNIKRVSEIVSRLSKFSVDKKIPELHADIISSKSETTIVDAKIF